ncbi:hypothetical protein ABXL76_11470 [Enterococcus faecalis]
MNKINMKKKNKNISKKILIKEIKKNKKDENKKMCTCCGCGGPDTPL